MDRYKILNDLIWEDEVFLEKEDHEKICVFLDAIGLVALLKKSVNLNFVSKDIKRVVNYQFKKNVIDNDLRKYAELFWEFERNNINYVVLKGSYLIQSVYGKVGYRHSNDLDILIERDNLEKTVFMLNELGFRNGYFDNKEKKIKDLTRKDIVLYEMNTNQIAPYVKINDNYRAYPCTLDIHVALDIKDEKNNFVWNGKYVYEEIGGVKFRRLENERFWLQVCIHHYKHMHDEKIIKRGSTGLRYVCDVYFFFLKNYYKFNIIKMIEIIKENCLQEKVQYFLEYGQEVWGKNAVVNEFLLETR